MEGPPTLEPGPETPPVPDPVPQQPVGTEAEPDRLVMEDVDERRAFNSARAMRIDETNEEFHAERERAWAAKQAAEGVRSGETLEQKAASPENGVEQKPVALPGAEIAPVQAERLPEESWKRAQASATENIMQYVTGAGPFQREVSDEEQGLLSRMAAEAARVRRENPDAAALNFDFSQNPDAYRIWSGLINRMAQDRISQNSNGVVETVAPSSPEAREEDQENGRALKEADRLIARRIARNPNNPERQEGYRRMLENLHQQNDKEAIAKLVVNELLYEKRLANYPQSPGYEEAWELANTDPTLNAHTENDWVYRGISPDPAKGEKTVTRGSLNINIGPEAVRDLDRLITQGVIRANYKFGGPGTGAEASERHDAATVYFLEEPSEEAKQALSEIAQKYYRGHDLLGGKISEGFSMSEIGSIRDAHAKEFLEQLGAQDPKLGAAMRSFLTSKDKTTGKERIGMSEGSYYAVKETLGLYDLDMHYDSQTGFSLSSQTPTESTT